MDIWYRYRGNLDECDERSMRRRDFIRWLVGGSLSAARTRSAGGEQGLSGGSNYPGYASLENGRP
jgi:hypothetical protein